MRSFGFEAVAESDARVLILGSLPGAESLRQRQYYAHRQNSFWWIMGELFGARPDRDYLDRLQILTKNYVALWDVCRSAHRPGSLDSSIAAATVVANDFERFFARHTQVRKICFNGQGAAKLFQQKVRDIPAWAGALPRVVLDSTSPAHASVSRDTKLRRWAEALLPVSGQDAKTPATPA